MYFRGLKAIKEFTNRPNFRCSGHKALRIAAEQQLEREHFMSHREMRGYWDEPRASLYGPCSMVSNWLRFKGVSCI